MADTLAILVGGGPAPGINGVIASATIEAINAGLDVIGIYDGYLDLAAGTPVKTVRLTIDDAARIQSSGGSFLRTSRTNPAKDDATLDRAVRSLDALRIRYLICIGGDDTTFGATRIAERTAGRIGVATVPKTIDNDLPLPENAPTFGFETARAVGAQIIETLLTDARTTTRWYIVVSMGRKSGSLALGMASAAGATLAVIPEEFPGETLELETVVDLLCDAIVTRRNHGRHDGVAVVAEGIVERISADALDALENVSRDAYGHVRLADVPLGALLRDQVRARLAELGVETTVLTKDIGYELRCAKPIPFDVEYTRTLGYGAVRYLLGGGSGALVALANGHVQPLALADLLDPQTGRVRTRHVDIGSDAYKAARSGFSRALLG
ncbi:MAG TPA: 6-phosphofructokinase [Candidatus Acidoferrales bacterium]|nr:6-phosphofructokinase [Candidatus Acidoferrales bacterium]